MEIFVFWIGLALLVGVVGKERKIGFGLAFLWAILLSPIIGLVIALLSEKKSSNTNYVPPYSDYRDRPVMPSQSLNNKTSSTSNDNAKMSLKEWGEKNPGKTINDYYRENGH